MCMDTSHVRMYMGMNVYVLCVSHMFVVLHNEGSGMSIELLWTIIWGPVCTIESFIQIVYTQNNLKWAHSINLFISIPGKHTKLCEKQCVVYQAKHYLKSWLSIVYQWHKRQTWDNHEPFSWSEGTLAQKPHHLQRKLWRPCSFGKWYQEWDPVSFLWGSTHTLHQWWGCW